MVTLAMPMPWWLVSWKWTANWLLPSDGQTKPTLMT